MCILLLAQVGIRRLSYDRRIQQDHAEMQLKEDRWLLRKGVEAADDEREILRLLRQIADAFDEFQVRAYSSRALTRITNNSRPKCSSGSKEIPTISYRCVCPLIQSTKIYAHDMS